MTKRIKVAKRRDRKTGLSPYAKYQKAPYEYSAAYRAWKSANKAGGGKRKAEASAS